MSEEPQPAPEPDRRDPRSKPVPPPFRPNMDLIGYIEEGQRPPKRRKGHRSDRQ